LLGAMEKCSCLRFFFFFFCCTVRGASCFRRTDCYVAKAVELLARWLRCRMCYWAVVAIPPQSFTSSTCEWCARVSIKSDRGKCVSYGSVRNHGIEYSCTSLVRGASTLQRTSVVLLVKVHFINLTPHSTPWPFIPRKCRAWFRYSECWAFKC
jgi:hypothetical protein